VQKGYKQTEIGVIPKEWSVLKLQDCASFLDHKRIPIKDSDRKKMRGSYPYYGASGIIDYVDSYIFDGTYILLGEDGANIIDRSSRLAFIVNGKCWINNHAHVILPTPSIDIYFLSEYLESIKYDEYNTGTAQPKLNREKCNGIPIAVPSLNEQKRIAEALSDVDSMISSLEKLIAKKKAVKQGAMQELLTGKKRLPGFTGEWKEHILGDLCYLITKQTGFDYTNEIKPSLVDINSNGTLPFIQNKDFCGKIINIQTDYYIPYDVAIKYPRILLDETCLLISLSGRIGNVGLYEKSNGLSFIGGAVGICRFNDEKNAEWCMLYLQSSSGQKQIFECQKSGAQHNLTVEDVRKLVVKLPATLEEQTAIASILSDMDSEIEALEQKLDKTRQIKQGMMQQLLTGKIRLV